MLLAAQYLLSHRVHLGFGPRADLCFLLHADQSLWILQDSPTAEGTVFQEHRNQTVAKTEKQGSLRPAAADPVIKRKRTTLYPAAGQVETPGRKRMRPARGRAQGPG